MRITASIRSGLEREEAATAGDAGVVHEQVDARMALEDGRGRPVDLLPIGDVAELELAAELERERLEPLLPPGDEHAVPAARDELPRGCLADAARRAGDDGRLHARRPYLQTRTTRWASAWRPFASVTMACSVCRPLAAPPRFHAAE